MNNFTSMLLGIGLGMLFTVIGLNLHSHSEIDKNPDITLSEYWDGKK